MIRRSVKVKKRRRIWIILAIFFLLLPVVILGVGTVWLSPYAKEHMDMSLLELPEVNRPATLYVRAPTDRAARDGALTVAPGAAISPSERRIYVPIEEMPDQLLHAFIAIEDKRFYRHPGVDPLRTARAVLGYIGGNASFGGSTITQQLVKNLTGHDEPTPDRKIREIFLALDLERHADKSEVLECYLNIINLAEGCRGVGAAAARYFSKTPAELTLAECATLAAITQNPARFNPLKHPDAAKARRDVILREMHEQNYISDKELSDALATPLALHPGAIVPHQSDPSDEGKISSWYADMVVADVIHDLCDRLGYTYTAASELVYTGGIHIETAMDTELQAIVEAYYADLSHFPTGDARVPQSACILMDAATGDILAVAGAIGEKNANRLQNYATDTHRPAGSCIKPLSLYAPALEKGVVTWSSILEDAPMSELNGRPWPRNADGLYRGRVTVGTSLAESLNTVAVRLLDMVGEDTSLSYLREHFGMNGILPDADRTQASLALGQQSRGVTLRELTAAYSAFPGGIARPAISYHRVWDRHGTLLLENPVGQGRQAVTPETAALMTRLLGEVTGRGTASSYITVDERLGIETAGKTGTTQNNCDRRFVGMTPRLLGGVWMGYDYPSELRGIQGNPCVRIWDDLMNLCEPAYHGAPWRQTFDLGVHLAEAEFCPLSGALITPDCVDPTTEGSSEHGWFIPGTEPHTFCREHEAPPIITLPDSRFPDDPLRIPLLPEDVLPEPLIPESTPAEESPLRSPGFRHRFWWQRRAEPFCGFRQVFKFFSEKCVLVHTRNTIS